MTQRRSHHISTFGSQLITIVSVALVLLIFGVLALLGTAGHAGSDLIKSNIGFIVKVDRTATDADVNRLKKTLNESQYVREYVYSSADEILAVESQYIGEDLLALVDVNPYGAEFDVKVKPEYANIDSLESIQANLAADVAIDDVLTESSMISAVNSALDRLTMILGAIALVLIVISVVLIYNTVHLAIYSRRFVIYTMKLVGATAGFIRKPFLVAGALNGMISAALASLLLICIVLYGVNVDRLLSETISMSLCAFVVLLLFVVGVTLCVFASFFATNRYLKQTYDDMFMK